MSTTVSELLEKYKSEVAVKNSKKSDDDVSVKENIEISISTVNAWIIRKVEHQKLVLRDRLSKTVIGFIWVQLIFFNLVVLLIVLSVTTNWGIFRTIDNALATLLFEFLKYYISVTIAELLGMLVFILHYVFSKYSGMELFRRGFGKNIEQEVD